MQKTANGYCTAWWRQQWLSQMSRVMRLTVILLTVGFLQVHANGISQKVTLRAENISVEEMFSAVKSQTGFTVVGERSLMETGKKVSVDVVNMELEAFLKIALKNQPFVFELSENTIIISGKPATRISAALDDAPIAAPPVRGIIIGSNSQPLAGANIMVKGTKRGTTSDANGNFELEAKESEILIITSIGYVEKRVTVGSSDNIGIVALAIAESKLDEVQIIAYGQTSTRLSTGNISSVKAKDIEKAPVANPLLAIAGRVPGVFIQQSSGVPGAGVKILIQGQNSVRYGNDPFYVVDGVPYVAQLLPGLTNELGESGASPKMGGNTSGNPLNFINPQDIESIDILKDADATAIYGSRAANGAILITTKKGKVGRTAVNFNLQQGYSKMQKELDMLNTEQYLEMRKLAYLNNNEPVPTDWTSFQFDLTVFDQNRYTKWQKELIGGNSKYTNGIVSINGGNANTQFFMSAGYQRDGTVVAGDLRDQKASVHVNINNVSENKRFKFGMSGSYVNGDNRLAGVSGIVSSAVRLLPPNAPAIFNEDGSLNWEIQANGFPAFQNPLSGLLYQYLVKTTNLVANTSLSYEIIKGLEIKSTFGYHSLKSEEMFGNKINQLPAFRKTFTRRTTEFNTGSITSWIIEPQLKYSRQIYAGQFEALLGGTITQQNNFREKLQATGFPSDEVIFNKKAATSIIVDPFDDNAVIISQYKYNALFGRINYNINDKYIASFNLRRDNSSRFGKENSFHNFWSVGAAWIFSSEKFFSENSVFSFGKLKASYGTTGNDQIGDYAYLNLYNYTIDNGVTYLGVRGLEPGPNFPNPYLQWEETKKFSTTLDLGFFKDRLLASATFFRNVTSNQLLFESMPSITGGYGAMVNLPAKVQNTGLEIVITTSNITTKNFKWTSSFNLTVPNNKFYEYIGPNQVRDDADGKPLNIARVYRYVGVDPQTGLYTVADKDGNPTSTPDPGRDAVVFINTNSRFYGGLQNSVSFRGFSLDFLFQFVKKVGPTSYFGLSTPGSQALNQPVSVLDSWKKPGDKATIQKYSTDFRAADAWLAAISSDRGWEDASFIRLKNLSFSYSLPASWSRNAKISTARLFVQGQNVFTVTNYSGLDPESLTLYSLPPLTTITFGVQLGL